MSASHRDQSCRGRAGPGGRVSLSSHRAPGPWIARLTAILIATLGVWNTSFAQFQSESWSGPSPHQPATPAVHYDQPGNDPRIRQTQVTTDRRRPLDRRISAMPRSEQKLEVIRNRSQLVVTRDRITRMAVSDPSILDIVQFSETEISLIGNGLGTTDLWLWFEGQQDPLMYVVTVIRDPALEEQRRIDYGRIERKLALLYPNSKVYLIPMSRKIIVRGQAKDAAEAAKIMQIVRGEVIEQEGDIYGYGDVVQAGGINPGTGLDNFNRTNNFFSSLIVDELQVPGEFHVMTRVRIAELNRSQLRRMGVDWNAIFRNGRHAIGQTLTGGAGVLTGVFENGEISVALDWLASNGSARILEDAQLITLSGEPAAFLSGGEFAVPTIVGIGGAQGQQTAFRGFGTSIITTPTVVDRDLIRLQIVPELSAVDAGNAVQGIPGVNVRRVQTRVELREGQTIVLGGLFSRREQAEVTRIPFLGEIPVIGNYLFNAKQGTEDENELLIVVTPEIVRPMDPDQVPPLPGHYVTHPDDIDLYKYNRIEGNPDLGHYQLLPYGNGQGYGHDVGYNFFNPPPADNYIAPAATMPPPAYGPGQQRYGDPHLQPDAQPGQHNWPSQQPRFQPPPAPPAGPQRSPEPTPAGPQTRSGPHSSGVRHASGMNGHSYR
jgi:pilus assembly protein CpaC